MTRGGWLRAALVTVALVALAVRLSTVPLPDFESDGTLIPQLTRVVEAGNQGLLFQAAPGVSMVLPAYDLGMFAWPSLAIHAVKSVWPGWTADLSIWSWLQFAFFAGAVCVCALPGVPMRLSAVAIVFLVGHVVLAGDDPLGGLFAPHYYGYWAPPLAALVTLVWLCALTLPARPGRRVLTAAAGLFVGALGTWRVDAALIPALAALGLAAVLALSAVVARLGLAPGDAERAAVRARLPLTLFCVAFVAFTRVPDLALRGALGCHQSATGVKHFEGGAVRGHLYWHNLYLSYASVPLAGPRAEWDDTIGWFHACEHEPRLTTAQSEGVFSRDHDRALLSLYLTTAFEDPVLWLTALAKRGVELADQCWPSLCGTLMAIGVALAMKRGARPWTLELPRGHLSVAFQDSGAGATWSLGPVVALAVLSATALPPLLYSTLPWYARATIVTARALPWLMLAGFASAGSEALTPRVDRSLRRASVRIGLIGVGALWTLGTAGLFLHAAYVSGLNHLTLERWAALWDASPRRLRTHLPHASRGTLTRLAQMMRDRYGVVKGGGIVDTREAPHAAAKLLTIARVGTHVVCWFEATAPWPGKSAMRDSGGWLDLELTGPCPGSYRMRVPSFARGEIFPVLVPVSPADDTPVTARLALRAWPAATGSVPVATVHGLQRSLSW